MAQPKPSSDMTADQLLALNMRLMQSLYEAGAVRIRLERALDANQWPDFRSLPLLPTPADLREN